ncbi:MAG: CBS domain-containing protein [Gaiellaceae bacterium]
MSELVRDAMVREPLALEADRSAREAGEALSRPDVRVVFIVSERRLVGAVTRKTLVREIVAAGRDPETTLLGEIAERPNHTIASDMPLDQAFGELEELDLERVPVVDGERLVGVLSRSVVQRRLADEPPLEQDVES